MKPNAWYLAPILLPVAAVAWNGHYAAQLGVLGITLGIFFGTLSLRRPSGDATSTGHG